MKIKCDYCGSMVDENQKQCPNCGGPLSGVNRMADETPKTIEELRQWYQAHNLPPEEVTRFFIGKDYKDPRAFGIYQDDSGDFVVYKNKTDGSRAVRYQGADEAYAVNELYQRLKSEIADQKSKNAGQGSKAKGNHSSSGCLSGLILLIVAMGILIAVFDKSPSKGYYRYGDHDYYYQNSSWYYYDDYADTWYKADNESELNETINSDSESAYKIDTHEGQSFEDSSWYDAGNDSGWDSDSNWDSNDSWDTGGMDFDSDW